MGLTQQIIESPEGGTVSLTGDELPGTGYFVGGVVSPLIIPNLRFTPDALFQIDAFINHLNSPDVGAAYLGWWTDSETGKLYLDATSHHQARDVAEKISLRRREIAFWDIANEAEIRTPADDAPSTHVADCTCIYCIPNHSEGQQP